MVLILLRGVQWELSPCLLASTDRGADDDDLAKTLRLNRGRIF